MDDDKLLCEPWISVTAQQHKSTKRIYVGSGQIKEDTGHNKTGNIWPEEQLSAQSRKKCDEEEPK